MSPNSSFLVSEKYSAVYKIFVLYQKSCLGDSFLRIPFLVKREYLIFYQNFCTLPKNSCFTKNFVFYQKFRAPEEQVLRMHIPWNMFWEQLTIDLCYNYWIPSGIFCRYLAIINLLMYVLIKFAAIMEVTVARCHGFRAHQVLLYWIIYEERLPWLPLTGKARKAATLWSINWGSLWYRPSQFSWIKKTKTFFIYICWLSQPTG